VFHAAQATLYVEGKASREEGRLLGDLYDHRQEADYRLTTPDAEVDALISDVDAFVAHMATLVEEQRESE
jgi:uncharacterized protein (UPF0332 family)